MSKPSKPRWNSEDIENLKELYSNNTNKYISEKLNRSHDSIRKMASRLNLFKNQDQISKSQKDRERKYSHLEDEELFDALLKSSLKYKTKSSFRANDQISKKSGYFNEICGHMIHQNFSRPQLILEFIISKIFDYEIIRNARDIINPFELDIYIP